MTDKKIVSLQAVPEQAKPVEEDKKYKVSDELIKQLEDVLHKLKCETDYEVCDRAVEALCSQLELVQQGAVHDVLITGAHKDAVWLDGCSFDYAFCEQTARQPYKFMLLVEEAAKLCVHDLKLQLMGVDYGED